MHQSGIIQTRETANASKIVIIIALHYACLFCQQKHPLKEVLEDTEH